MFDRSRFHITQQKRRRRRMFIGVSLFVAVVIVAVIVGILIGANGISAALPAIIGGSAFTITVVLYWARMEKDIASTDGFDE